MSKFRIIVFAVLALFLFPIAAWAAQNSMMNAQLELQRLLKPIDFRVELIFLGRMVGAFILGAITGMTHDGWKDVVSLRRFGAVALGASIFASIGLHLAMAYNNQYALTIISGIVMGVGFMAGSFIFKQESIGSVRGISSAAALWAIAAVGMAVGVGMYIIALGGTVLICSFLIYSRLFAKRYPLSK